MQAEGGLIVATSTAAARVARQLCIVQGRKGGDPFIDGASWRGGARMSRHPKAAVWAQDGVDMRPSMAVAPLGERRGRHGLAMARAARGARGVGEGGGATQGGSTARGPAGQSRPRHALRRGTAVTGGRARRRERTESRRVLVPSQCKVALFDRVFLTILTHKWTKRIIGKL
jgi:hypothetical protein